MQDYSYSALSMVAIALHLIFNYGRLLGRGERSASAIRYRWFLVGVLIYYISDALWGVLAGLDWTGCLYVDTVFYFISLPLFVFLWFRFAIAYLRIKGWQSRVLKWSGYAHLGINMAMLVANFFNNCFFSFDETGAYVAGGCRVMMLYVMIAYLVELMACAFAKGLGSGDAIRRRCMIVVLYCFATGLFVSLHVVWPLTPLTTLGCLIGTCFLHVFIIQDEQTTRHMAVLERSLASARAAEKTRRMFFSIVSHDIRTPLNAILGYSDLLRRGVGSPAERDEALESIQASGTTLLQLVDDVLNLAKMDAGKLTLHPQPLSLDRLTDEVLSSFRLAASRKGVKLENKTSDVPVVQLDEHRFRQILFNLVGNAVKFTSKGAVTVSASCSDERLEVAVSDTGVGIPPEMLSRILDPFVQVQDPSHAADRAGGTGLGLSICRRLVETMGGDLLVESELGRGSTFIIRIPGVQTGDAEAKPAESPSQTVPVESLPKRVLVVDDSPVNRSVLSAFLKKAGVPAVEQAGDGVEAMEKLESSAVAGNPCDMVFSDFWMPNMNGLELIVRIRADPRFVKLPVFAVTADTEFQRDERSKLFTHVLFKPLTYAKLVEVLAKGRA